jgi:hypothetical protein
MEQETVSAPGGNGKEESMGKERMATVLAAAMVVALVCGCATIGKGPSDEELITQTLDGYASGLVEQDIDKMMAAYSDDFETEDGLGKEDLREFMSGAIDQGYLDDVEADAEDCEIKIEDGKATAGPVVYSSAMGSITVEYTMKKEADGVWRIVESFMY